MVKSLHAAGIEVILDVVYNHTAEGGADGPTTAFRGLGRPRLLQALRRTVGDAYWDVTGCGNTVDVANLDALRLVLDSLRYWVTEMHVDGFRFDLAVRAGARPATTSTCAAPFLTTISQDPVLRHVKLIAEPWDVVHGRLPGRRVPAAVGRVERPVPRHVRDFWRGRPGGIRDVASRLAGLVRPVRRRRPLAVRLGELRHRPRRLHRCATWCPTTASTTRPTARTTATAPTTTAPGTTASRARPTTRRSSRCGAGRRRNLLATLLPVDRRRR